jgi:hypothetical protein
MVTSKWNCDNFLPRCCFGFSVFIIPPVLHRHIYLICHRYCVIVEVDTLLYNKCMRSCRFNFFKQFNGPFGVFSYILTKFNLFFSVDPFTRKDWYDVKAPSMFATRQIGKTLVNRTQGTSKFLFWSYLYNQNCHAGRAWEISGRHFLEVSFEL